MQDSTNSIVFTYALLAIVLMLFVAFIIVFVFVYKKRQNQMLVEQQLKESEYQKRLLRQEIERIKSIQSERERISRDLHDDIGSGLSAMKLQAEYLESLPVEKWTRENLHDLVEESQELTSAMREIVWSLNTQYDNLTDFIQYVRRYAVQYFDKSNIRLDIEVPKRIEALQLNGLIRRNVFLVYKEALHNALRHSEASIVSVNIDITENSLHISVKDNGKGFDVKKKVGNGTQNMRYRMDTIQGNYNLESSLSGTCCNFSVGL